MYYLDEDIIAVFESINIPETKTYKYHISYLQNEYWGNIFLTKGDNKRVEIDITDIAQIYTEDKRNFAHSSAQKNVIIPTKGETIASFWVELFYTDNVSEPDEETVCEITMIYRYPFKKKHLDINFKAATLYNQLQNGLLPRVPYVDTEKYGLGLLFRSRYPWQVVGDKLHPFQIQSQPAQLRNTVYMSLDALYNENPTGNDNGIYAGSEITGEPNDSWPFTEVIDIASEGQAVRIDETECRIVRAGYEYGYFTLYAVKSMGLDIIAEVIPVGAHASYTFKSQPDYTQVHLVYRAPTGASRVEPLFRLVFEGGIISANDTELSIEFDTARGDESELEVIVENIKTNYFHRTIIQKIAEFDCCPSRYYLQWVDRFGSLQSQPFDGRLVYTENIDTLEIQNYARHRRNVNWEIQPKWEINTKWLNEKVFPNYESIFVSPYLVLYDVKEDEVYDVILTDKTYKEETFRNDKKLFNLTLNIELDKKQNILG